MRFMMFVRADKNAEAGVMPSKELRQVFEAADFQ